VPEEEAPAVVEMVETPPFSLFFRAFWLLAASSISGDYLHCGPTKILLHME
jgi:hypothetical protein